MKVGRKSVLLCDCEGTMEIDGDAVARALDGDAPNIHTQLCRRQIDAFRQALASEEALVVCCTQEAPVFTETALEQTDDPKLSFTNLRERAGWSTQGSKAAPKIAALIAEAALDLPAAGSITMTSGGHTLVLGKGDTTLAAARRIAQWQQVTLVLEDAHELDPPAVTDMLVYKGSADTARGHFGNFEIDFSDLAQAKPSARKALKFDSGEKAALAADLVLDLRGGDPLFPSPDKRDGYFNPDPGDALRIAEALADLGQMVGEFEKPLYVSFDDRRCTHSRSQLSGCNRCLDLCPAGAIQPAGDVVNFDAHICAGCGNCAGVCPTDAAEYALPGTKALFERLRTLLTTYYNAGGKDAVLLIHDTRHGDELISALARHYDGLPANVLPFAVNQVSQIGFEFLLSAVAYGAHRVLVLTPPGALEDWAGLDIQVGYAEAALSGLGYGDDRLQLVQETDPEALAGVLKSVYADGAGPFAASAAMDRKRANLTLALAHLHENAPAPVDHVVMPEGAPVGAIKVDDAGCTLCLACVSTCPVGALGDNPESPMLRFNEAACVQCGLCRIACPEKVITLDPRLNFAAGATDWIVVKEEEPFNCISCGKPFAVKSTIDKMMEKLADNPMFVADPNALGRLKMCEDCRVVDMFEAPQPMAMGERPRIRTTDDYLRERDENDPPEEH